MIDLGPHAAFIWLSYGAALLVVAALIAWAFVGEARARAKLAELERRGAAADEAGAGLGADSNRGG